ncbi:hypothetical protein E5A73_01425 [Sphingomonas gei]|uniref:Uncharacterized protein n=1 Tax=Sphingomonas gei TaxID=1395960 RepID=A0A4S1XIJ0_9SPHN|nr:hypothetical protein [Sphingomonas gei]TGX55817.1 hypothetical protein E5A73_01425 [Sphingomonas gei]
MTRLLYLDQNAWVALARGAWDKASFPKEHAALSKVVEGVRAQAIAVPLSFANIYETAKINEPARRANMARTQAVISGGRVFRGRRRILGETLAAYLARHHNIARAEPDAQWFLSDLWFEAAADYSPQDYGFDIPQPVLDFLRADPVGALFDYLAFGDEDVRLEAVRRNSASSAALIAGIESRRPVAAGEALALRKRAYGARLILDELDFILATGRQLGLDWQTVRDIGSPLVRSIAVDIPILNVERELVVRLEDQARAITENDLRDMAAFTMVVPFADMVVAEKPFVNLARQARLDKHYGAVLMTSIFDL